MRERPVGGPALGLVAASLLALGGCASLGGENPASLIAPAFTRSEIVGFVAGLGTTFAALPDIIAMFKRRSSGGMNPRMAAIMGLFQIAWLYYGFLIASRPVIVWNAVAIVINALSVGAYCYFRRSERRRSGRD